MDARKKMTIVKVAKLVEKWKKILRLDAMWIITIKINKEKKDCKKNYRDAAAFIYVQEGYFTAELEVNAFNVKEVDLEYTIVHEMVHIVTSPMLTMSRCALGSRYDEVTRNANEAMTERIARVMWLLDKARTRRK